MSGLTYCGFDFSPYVQAELREPAAHAVAARTAAAPGRPGAVLLGGEVEPLVLPVRLFWDAGAADAEARARARRVLRARLLAPAGGELSLPGEPGLFWRDAVVTAAGAWDCLFDDGEAEVEFTCFDPIAYGDARTEPGCEFQVGGTWRTWPVVSMEASGAGDVEVRNAASGEYVRVAGAGFAPGAEVVADFAAETVTVRGSSRCELVELGSDFFALEPGPCTLEFSGCTAHEVRFFERWA